MVQMQLTGDKEICFAYNEDTITIVDVSRGVGGAWQSPTQISKLGYEGSRYTHQGWLDESHSFAYMNDELDEGSCCTGNTYTKTYIVNVTSLSSPSLDSIFRSSMISTDHNNYVVGDKLYQSNYVAGLRILQIQEDFKLKEVAYFVTPSAWSVYPYFPSGNIIVSSIPGGLFVLKQNSVPPTPAPPTPTPPSPTPPSPPAPSPSPTPPSTGECVHQKDCDVSPWCTNTGFEEWCRTQGQSGSCPAPFCMRV